jgi:four helix bundle suffix protein
VRPSGGYRRLRSFQAATIIYDATVAFCGRFVDPRSRTVDQMVQAARSGRQNIAEGSLASATSSQTELRLVNVARASLEELLLDYQDFLRQRRLVAWSKDDPEARRVRAVAQRHEFDEHEPLAPYTAWLNDRDPAVVANALICLVHQAKYLLDRQIAWLEQHFIAEGGYSERLAAARVAERQKQWQQQRGAHLSDSSDSSDAPDRTTRTHRTDQTAPRAHPPACPLCGQAMVLRTARQGPRTGERFWGCSHWPDCRGTRPQPAQR